MTRLYLCEKPSQARDIAAVLGASRKSDGCLVGDNVVVTWCIGHLLEMVPPEEYDARYKRWALDDLPILPTQWKMAVTPRGASQYKAVQACLTQASEVVIATDADREGETIAREILERCRWRGPVKRLWLSALDSASIRKALGNLLPGDKTEPLYRAGLGRARADWLVGMNLSRLFTLAGRRSGGDAVVSVGRVQTPALKLVVDRDLAIEHFKPTPFYDIVVVFAAAGGLYAGRWIPPRAVCDADGRCVDPGAARKVKEHITGQTGIVVSAHTE
ncbi:MAG: DNA topoisomerase III, partial [Gammaproteobacteria bacterium]|nr:DNA topoisomerase III [Gammaproteobacteria bacterium]